MRVAIQCMSKTCCSGHISHSRNVQSRATGIEDKWHHVLRAVVGARPVLRNALGWGPVPTSEIMFLGKLRGRHAPMPPCAAACPLFLKDPHVPSCAINGSSSWTKEPPGKRPARADCAPKKGVSERPHIVAMRLLSLTAQKRPAPAALPSCHGPGCQQHHVEVEKVPSKGRLVLWAEQ